MVHIVVVLGNYSVGPGILVYYSVDLGILGYSTEEAVLPCSNLMHFVLIFLVLLYLVLPALVGGCIVAAIGVDRSPGTDYVWNIVVVVVAEFIVTAL